ncbi:MAG: hypothetical protein KDC95_18770, partial [Planctomycetes bacterium]|nr:hypothetical protein [Planctomycetota bacterium]
MQVKTKTTAADAAKTDLLVLVISGDAKTLAFPDGYTDAANAARLAGDLPRDFRSTCALYPAGKANAKRT